ncbi:MAG TPA: response regulator [Verrucomicrobiae bacterium]|jgi:CheY-like chemotaxis protein
MNPTPAKNTRRWMLVDDDNNVLVFMKDIITHFGGIEAECYQSPYAAFAAFSLTPNEYELVITDLEMPGMDGIELCHSILKLRPDAKVLLSTGSAAVTDKSVTNHGFSGLLHKPVPFAEMRRLLGDMGIAEISHPSHPK